MASFSDDVEDEIKAMQGDIEREAVMKVWARHSRAIRSTGELMELLKEPLVEKYSDDLPLPGRASERSGGSTGNEKPRVTDDEKKTLKNAFRSAKATSKEYAKGRSQILEHVSGDVERYGKRWHSILEAIKKDGDKIGRTGEKRNQKVWLVEK